MRLNKEEPLSHLNTWKNRYKVGDDAILWHCGAHTCVSMFTEFILKIIFCSQPPPSLTLQLCSSHAIHFLWLISCLLSRPISNLPHQSRTITKSILGQMLWTGTQQMQDYSRSKSLLFDLLVPGTRVLDSPRAIFHLSPSVSLTKCTDFSYFWF